MPAEALKMGGGGPWQRSPGLGEQLPGCVRAQRDVYWHSANGGSCEWEGEAQAAKAMFMDVFI